MLLGNSAEDTRVFKIRFVARGLGAKNVHILVHFDLMSTNPQIVEAGTQKRDGRHLTFPIERMVRGNLAYYAIGCDHVENVEILNNGSSQRRKTTIRLEARVPRNLRVARPIGNHPVQPEGIRLFELVVPVLGQLHMYPRLDVLMQGSFDLRAKNIRGGVERV